VKVLLTGADGFIGRHIAFHLRNSGVAVLCLARNPTRMAAMGFATLRADLTDPATHDPGFWTPYLAPGTHLIHAAGLLTGSEAAFRAVHRTAPRAALSALQGEALLISAVGIANETPFSRWRRETERLFAAHTILRPGLVLADTSYGGSSLLRALASEIVHHCLMTPPGPGAWEVGGPETISQAGLIALIRRWLGLPPQAFLCIPGRVAARIGQVGDVLHFGPISATATAQLASGVLADPAPLLARLPCRPRSVSSFVMGRPAGTQDLWQARLYLLKPLIRLTLACLWLASAMLGLTLSGASFPEVAAPVLIARLGGLADLALAVALVTNWRPRITALLQLGLVISYTTGLTFLAPGLWLDPFGGLLKNLPVLALILVHLVLVEER
jgi:uncharacterized protein YbjT (DUF2867 family)